MGEEIVHLLREVFISSSLSCSQLRGTISNYSPVLGWRILQLKKGAFLAVSYKSIVAIDSSLSSDELVEFTMQSDNELLKMGRVASIINGATFSISALPQRFVAILRSNGELIQTSPEKQIESTSPQITLQFRISAVGILTTRPDGVRIFFDGMRSNSDGRKVSEFYRLIEAGFGLKGARVAKPLISFLSSGSFPIDLSTWQRLKNLRDRLSHAYRSGEISYESDAEKDMHLMRMIAADVLFHKSNWAATDALRVADNYFSTYRALDGTIMITRGSSPTMYIRIVDPVTGIPVHLSPQEHNTCYRRYADRFRSKNVTTG